ncbi:MAG: hypothetical protein H7Y22_14545 [Gemmatimonadaceae bacterium]|nr:hypothetical protein [Gloeobacterales cyanobacterium ES-bin-141]
MTQAPHGQDYIPQLPDIDPETSKLDPQRSGFWTGSSGVVLANIGTSLKVPDLPEGERTIDSIPDLWARPLLFTRALYDTRHKLHGQVLAEWRGMLALVALWETRSLSLEVRSLELPTNPNRTNPAFVRAAALLCPTEALSEDTPWEKVNVFYYDDRPIGMASPTTLVCTAVSTQGRLDERVSWQKGGALADPCDFLSTAERGAVSFWLKKLSEELIESLGPIKGRPRSLLNSLTRLLSEFCKSLGEPVDSQVSERELGLSVGLYRLLDRPLRTREIGLQQSAVALVPSAGFQPVRSLLVLETELAQKWAVNPAEVPVYGRTTLAGIDFRALDPDKPGQIGREVLQGAAWRTPELFFCERLLLIAPDNVADRFEGIREVEGQKNLLFDGRPAVPILPIRGELLDYLSAADLQERIRLFMEKDGSIRVEMRLTLVGVNNKPRSLTIKHLYSREAIDCRTTVPIIEIWPHFRSQTWKTYYTYFDTAVRRAQEIFVARPHCGAIHDPEFRPQVFQRSESDVRQLTRTTAPPTALVCTAQFPDVSAPVEVGFLLLQDFPTVQTSDAAWSLGIDFGTSATQVYYQSGGSDEPEPLEIPRQFLRVTPVSADDLDRLTTYFLPPFVPETPFLTLFRPEVGTERTPYIRGNIRYLKPGTLAKLLNQEGVHSGFKWSDNEEGKQLLAGFLEQLALQCAAAAAGRGARTVRWHVSYPSVFSRGANAFLKSTWRTIARNCDLPCRDDELVFRTESEAAARFFKQKQGIPFTETICIDIGGGTSDISVWEETSLQQQCSIRFAGETLFMDLLKANPSVLGIFNPDWERRLIEAKRGTNFYAEADSLLRAGREEIFERLPMVVDTTNRQDRIYRFIHLISLGTAGLVFYAGLLVRRLVEQKRWASKTLPYVCIGGNGARMFRWLSLGQEFDQEAAQHRLFRKVLEASTSLEAGAAFGVAISKLPKAEAAFGLIVPSKILFKREEEAKIELAGENFSLGVAADAPIDDAETWKWNLKAEVLASGLKAPATFKFLRTFIDAYNTYAATHESLARKVVYNDGVEKLVRDSVQEYLNSQKGIDEAAIVVEPIFITALKALLKLETDAWVGGK